MTTPRKTTTAAPAKIRRPAAKPKSLIEQLGEAKVAKDLAAARYDELADRFRAEHPATGAYAQGRVTVQVAPNRTWNKGKALESFGTAILSPQVDQELAKQVMTGAEYESFYVEAVNAQRITVKIA